jgi:hypothetical protein
MILWNITKKPPCWGTSTTLAVAVLASLWLITPAGTSGATEASGGSADVTGVNARPEAATNSNGTQHLVRVTLTGMGGPIEGVTPNSIVAQNAAGRPQGDVADPNAGTSPNATLGVFNVYDCTASDAEGISICTYQDPIETGPGTDTIVFYVNQASGGTAGPDASEPQDGVQKTWLNQTVHKREISLLFDHAGSQDNRVLVASGRLKVNDEFEDCVSSQQVLVQRRIDGNWVTKKTTVTNGQGEYAVEMSDRQGRYRALAPRFEFIDPATDWLQICTKGVKEKIHSHT